MTAWEAYLLPGSDGRMKKPGTLLENGLLDGEAYEKTKFSCLGPVRVSHLALFL